MRNKLYLFLCLAAFALAAQAQTEVYRGQVSVKQNRAEREGRTVEMDFDISLCGLSVGRYQTLTLIPMLRNGADSLLLPPVVVKGANPYKMYKRSVALNGKGIADGGAYAVLKNDPLLIQVVSYKKTFPYRPWMAGASFILVGELENYEGEPLQTFINVLTDRLNW